MCSGHTRFLIRAAAALALVALCLMGMQVTPARAQDLFSSVLADELDPHFAAEWMQTLYDRVMAEAINAPAAARLYGYAGITLYEAVVLGMPNNRSLSGQLTDMPDMPYPSEDQVLDWPTVANAALKTTLIGLMGSTSQETVDAFNDLYARQLADRSAVIGDETIISASVEYGDELAKAILEWASEDNYESTRQLTAEYEPPTGDPSLWVLTTRGTRAAEPYWGQIRPFALSYVDECAVPLNMAFSTDEDSTFYAQAMEVRNVGDNLTREQRAIAEWWVDTPGITGAPAGHWVLIENQMIDHLGLNLTQAAEMYGMVGMVLSDAFISAWSLKYQVNLLRPVTYINQYISRRWQPYIETPPFPEYPSGHSVVSAAAADMLTFLFGTVAFTDRTHEVRGMGVRSYTSFEAAAYEAAISRLYGGIHFRAAIENGMRQGRCVTERTLDYIVMRPLSQGE